MLVCLIVSGGGVSRTKVMSGLAPGVVVRLNAGIYSLVSAYGDANAVARADVTVEAGKLTEATLMHAAAKATFKLVARSGGDAVTQRAAVLDIGVYVADGDLAGPLVRPVKEEAQVAGVVQVGRGVRALPAEPFLKTVDFGYHDEAS